MPVVRASRTGSALAAVMMVLALLAGCAGVTSGTGQRADATGIAGGPGNTAGVPGNTGTPAMPGRSSAAGPLSEVPPHAPSSTGAAGPGPVTPPARSTGQQPGPGPTAPTAPTGSTGQAGPTGSANWVVTVVRHAERADDGTSDPPLTSAGEDRAQRLAGLLQPDRGVAVYATPFRRTQSTAQPTAAAWNVQTTTYDPTQDANALLDRVASEHPSGAILIVGHSDTVPGIVAALCGCSVPSIAETDFGKLFRVSIAADGTVLDFTSQDSY